MKNNQYTKKFLITLAVFVTIYATTITLKNYKSEQRDAQYKSDQTYYNSEIKPQKTRRAHHSTRSQNIQSSDICMDFWRTQYESNIPGAVVVLKDSGNINTKHLQKTEPGTIVKYFGHYENGNKHEYTMLCMGNKISDADFFVPDSNESESPILDSIVLVNIAKIAKYNAKQR